MTKASPRDHAKHHWLPLAGAPLDVVKVAAAALMLGDHLNHILLRSEAGLLWSLGRIAFPLFCFVTACHLLRGADPRRYVVLLLLFAVPTQPIFGLAFGNELGSILFTLAAGAVLALFLDRVAPWAMHAAFAAGIAVTFAAPSVARSGVDFGIPGMLLPAVMLAALRGGGVNILWLVGVLFSLNAHVPRAPEADAWYETLMDGAFATIGTGLVVAASALFHDLPRFMPRYALYLFYPGHLALLSIARALL